MERDTRDSGALIYRLGIEDVLTIHTWEIAQGALIADRYVALEGALDAPFAGHVDGEFYPTPVAKAGKLVEAVVRVHAFTDGNKRIAWLSAMALLDLNGVPLRDAESQQETAADMVERYVTKEIGDGELAFWMLDFI